MPWGPATHARFPPDFQQRVQALLLSWHRCSRAPPAAATAAPYSTRRRYLPSCVAAKLGRLCDPGELPAEAGACSAAGGVCTLGSLPQVCGEWKSRPAAHASCLCAGHHMRAAPAACKSARAHPPTRPSACLHRSWCWRCCSWRRPTFRTWSDRPSRPAPTRGTTRLRSELCSSAAEATCWEAGCVLSAGWGRAAQTSRGHPVLPRCCCALGAVARQAWTLSNVTQM